MRLKEGAWRYRDKFGRSAPSTFGQGLGGTRIWYRAKSQILLLYGCIEVSDKSHGRACWYRLEDKSNLGMSILIRFMYPNHRTCSFSIGLKTGKDQVQQWDNLFLYLQEDVGTRTPKYLANQFYHFKEKGYCIGELSSGERNMLKASAFS